MTSSIVMIPIASSSSGRVGSGFPSICRMSESTSLFHFLLLVLVVYELALFGKLFHFFNDFSDFSPSISTLTSLTATWFAFLR
ncbi:hypothetical protein LINGRAHAP2_LOCUS6848, partial [Linum grandiflorum]